MRTWTPKFDKESPGFTYGLNMPASLWEKLDNYAQSKGVTHQRAIADLLDRVPELESELEQARLANQELLKRGLR